MISPRDTWGFFGACLIGFGLLLLIVWMESRYGN